MPTSKKIKQNSQRIAQLERRLALAKMKKRKTETRHKIQLGGLIVKAQLDNLPKDVILGLLVHAKQEMEKDTGAKSLYQSIGQAAFMGYDQ